MNVIPIGIWKFVYLFFKVEVAFYVGLRINHNNTPEDSWNQIFKAILADHSAINDASIINQSRISPRTDYK